MHTIPTSNLASFVSHIALDMAMPVMIWGSPGIGKSEIMAQLAETTDSIIVDIRLSQYESVDLRGLPDIERGKTVWNMPSTIPFEGSDFPTDRPILLFFDEINAAAPSVSAVAYQIINDGACGEHKLLPNVRIVAAGNREGDRGVTNKMPTPLANRFVHVETAPSPEGLAVYFQKALPKKVAGLAAAFLMFRKNLVNTFDPASPDKAFATPRSWEKAFRIWERGLPADIAHAGMAGSVGDGPAAEFMGFVKVWESIIPVEKIIEDPTGVTVPEELSVLYATTVSISGSMDTKNADALQQFLDRLPEEFGVLCWSLATKRDDALFGTKAFISYAKRTKAALI